MGFWTGKRVLVTGHTGFKGAWLCEMLLAEGAEVFGLALAPETEPALFDQLGLANRVDHAVLDLRDADAVRQRVAACRPDIVFHLAAQALVLRSYEDPLETWSTNVLGTAHLLDALRTLKAPCAVVCVTTDKVYENREWEHPYREPDRLGGHDPYSASKAGTELVLASYRKSFFTDGMVRMASARAGNVIGGGDWAAHRLLPDLARAFAADDTLVLRNPNAIRPWQHVLDPLTGYMTLARALVEHGGPDIETAFNFGPYLSDTRRVQDLIEVAVQTWPGAYEIQHDDQAPHEAGRLALGIERARLVLDWHPKWPIERAVSETVAWYRAIHDGGDPRAVTQAQIASFGVTP